MIWLSVRFTCLKERLESGFNKFSEMEVVKFKVSVFLLLAVILCCVMHGNKIYCVNLYAEL